MHDLTVVCVRENTCDRADERDGLARFELPPGEDVRQRCARWPLRRHPGTTVRHHALVDELRDAWNNQASESCVRARENRTSINALSASLANSMRMGSPDVDGLRVVAARRDAAESAGTLPRSRRS